MGATCTKCRKVAVDVIPDKQVMLDIVDRIVLFEDMMREGKPLTRSEEAERKKLASVAREVQRVRARE